MTDPLSGISGGPGPLAGVRQAATSSPTGDVAKAFGDYLTEALATVNQEGSTATALTEQFAAGAPIDVSQVAIAMEQAGLAMQLLIEVRNQVLEAYNTLLRMPV